MEPVSKGRQGMKRGGLGRGLSALIPGAVEEGAGLLEIPVGAIGPNPRQPRTTFQDESLDALAVSIKEVGVLQPIVVRRGDSGFELIAGERRLRAAKAAGLATIPAGHGRALLALGDGEAQRSLALRAAGEELSVRDVEEVVRRLVDQPPPEATTARVTPRREGISLAEVEEILSEQLATRVSIQMGRKRGRIVIEFGSADDLERIVSEIIGSGPGLAPSD